MVSKSEMKKLINEKKKELKIARAYFNECSVEDFELANIKVSALEAELSKLIRESKLL